MIAAAIIGLLVGFALGAATMFGIFYAVYINDTNPKTPPCKTSTP